MSVVVRCRRTGGQQQAGVGRGLIPNCRHRGVGHAWRLTIARERELRVHGEQERWRAREKRKNGREMARPGRLRRVSSGAFWDGPCSCPAVSQPRQHHPFTWARSQLASLPRAVMATQAPAPAAAEPNAVAARFRSRRCVRTDIRSWLGVNSIVKALEWVGRRGDGNAGRHEPLVLGCSTVGRRCGGACEGRPLLRKFGGSAVPTPSSWPGGHAAGLRPSR